MTKQQRNDDFEAVRALVDALQPFEPKDRERIMRWAREKLEMSPDGPMFPRDDGDAVRGGSVSAVPSDGLGSVSARDIKSFVEEKNPRSDNQFVAAVAYYYKFEAPSDQRKDYITSEDLQNACRYADRKRFDSPSNTLNNAYKAGLLDRLDQGKYRINTVGENLVAMVLPGEGASKIRSGRKKMPFATPRKKLGKKSRK